MPNEKYKIKEAQWKKSVAITHRLFCDCIDFTKHFKWLGSPENSGYNENLETLLAAMEHSEGGTTSGIGGPKKEEEDTAVAVNFVLDESR